MRKYNFLLKNSIFVILSYQKDRSYNSFCSRLYKNLNYFFKQSINNFQVYVIKRDESLHIEYNDTDFLFIENTDKDKFLMKIEIELEQRKKYNNLFRPLIIINQGQELLKFKDSYKYNIFTISLLDEFSVQPKDFNILKSNAKIRIPRFNFIKQEDSFIMENSILISHLINHKLVFERISELPLGFRRLSIENIYDLLDKDIISFKDVEMINSESKEECLLLLKEKIKLLKMIN